MIKRSDALQPRNSGKVISSFKFSCLPPKKLNSLFASVSQDVRVAEYLF